MPFTLLYNNRQDQMPDLLRVDNLSKYDVKYSYDITDHPVEKGSFINDHVSLKPTEIEAEIFVPNISEQVKWRFINGKLIPSPPINPQNLYFEQKKEDVLDLLVMLADSATLCTLVLDDEFFEDVLIQNVSKPTSIEDGNSYSITIGFKQVNIVQTQKVAVDTRLFKKKLTSSQKKKLTSSQKKNINNSSKQANKGTQSGLYTGNFSRQAISHMFGISTEEIANRTGYLSDKEIDAAIKKFPGKKTELTQLRKVVKDVPNKDHAEARKVKPQ